MNSLGISPVHSRQPPIVFPAPPSSPRYVATAASNSCPPSHILEDHFRHDRPPSDGSNPNRLHSVHIDEMSLHLLVETAVYDSSEYDIMTPEELDAAKKEYANITARMDAAKRKLALESKVRDAALSLSRLYSKKNSGSGGRRKSLLGGGNSGPSKDDKELMQSNQKCEQIAQELWRLNNRAIEIQRRLLMHSAGVLGRVQQQKERRRSIEEREFGEQSMYRAPGDMGGFGLAIGGQEDMDGFVAERIEDINERFQQTLMESAREKGLPMPPPMQGRGLHEQLALLEQNISYIHEFPPGGSGDPATEGKLEQAETIMMALWDMLDDGQDFGPYSLSAFSAKVQSLVTTNMNLLNEQDGLKQQLTQQQDELLEAKEKMQEMMEEIAEAQSALDEKKEQLVTVMHQLDTQRKKDQRKTMEMNATLDKESAALTAERQAREELQAALDSEREARIHAEESVGKFVREKEEALLELTEQLQEMQSDRDVTKAELDAIVSDTESRLQSLESEITSLKSARDAARTASTETETSLRTLLAEKDSEITKMDAELHELSSKVAELSTEVVMAKAELDTAYGSKSQRAAETAQAAAAAAALAAAAQSKPQTVDPSLLQEIDDLSRKNAALISEMVALKNSEQRARDLQTELDGMLRDFEALTKQSIENEHERTALERSVDALKEKLEALETQLGEERIRGLGPRQGSVDANGRVPRGGESTSMAVLKQEFKKMMRDMRAESAKALRAEQEERRKLESMIRGMKKEQFTKRARTGTQSTSAS